MLRRLVALAGLAALIWFWNHTAKLWHTDTTGFYIMFPLLLLVPIVALIGRLLLRKVRSLEQVAWITLFVHYSIVFAMGWSIIVAFTMARVHPFYVIPFSRTLGLVLMGVTAAVVTVTVATLALRGLGAPFAISLSRRLATDWLYRYTRNPMVVSLIAFFIAAGLWLQSALFLIWALGALTPAELLFLKIYEERELELRFGESYLAYKRSTPMLLGFRHRAQSVAAANRQ